MCPCNELITHMVSLPWSERLALPCILKTIGQDVIGAIFCYTCSLVHWERRTFFNIPVLIETFCCIARGKEMALRSYTYRGVLQRTNGSAKKNSSNEREREREQCLLECCASSCLLLVFCEWSGGFFILFKLAVPVTTMTSIANETCELSGGVAFQ